MANANRWYTDAPRHYTAANIGLENAGSNFLFISNKANVFGDFRDWRSNILPIMMIVKQDSLGRESATKRSVVFSLSDPVFPVGFHSLTVQITIVLI